MSKLENSYVKGDLNQHPAAQAWSRFEGRPVTPDAIFVLKQKKNINKGKSAVYRLEGVGPRGRSVVAKRCRRTTGEYELRIYQYLAAVLSLKTIECFGYIEDSDSEVSWLFLADGGSTRYDPDNAHHRALTARYLAQLHTLPLDDELRKHLADRGPDHYLRSLQRSCALISETIQVQTDMDGQTRKIAQTQIDRLRRIEEQWDLISAPSSDLPNVLVHSDLASKNMLVYHGQGSAHLSVVDWEMAGLGLAGIDLATSDVAESHELEVYLAQVNRKRVIAYPKQSDWLVWFGKLCRTLAGSWWASQSFCWKPERYALDFISYQRKLDEIDIQARVKP